jgi:nucleoside-diphosphate-sugar epimerase
MNKVLITGHRGWIGSNFTKLLDSLGIFWVGIDRLDGEDLLKDITPFQEKLADCDIVVHLAATPRIPASWANADHYRDNNIGVTDQIARICAEQHKHLIFASSSSVYGDGDGPLNPYSWTKYAGEQSIQMYSRSRNLEYTILRIFTNYGEDDPSGLVISRWLDQYKKGEPLLLRGTGNQSRDFIHVKDTCRAILACCLEKPLNRVLDIGTGVNVKLIDIVKAFNCEYTTEPELPGYASSTRANAYNTRKFINWTPEYQLLGWIKENLALDQDQQ